MRRGSTSANKSLSFLGFHSPHLQVTFTLCWASTAKRSRASLCSRSLKPCTGLGKATWALPNIHVGAWERCLCLPRAALSLGQSLGQLCPWRPPHTPRTLGLWGSKPQFPRAAKPWTRLLTCLPLLEPLHHRFFLP